MSKSMNWRRSRREREEKKAGTCAHVKGIVSGRKRRRHIRNVTRARVRTMKWKRKGGHRYENRARFFDTERGKPAQKPTPTSPTHRSLPKEVRIINLEYLFPSTEKIKDFGKILKNAAVRKVILAAYKISTYHKYFRPRSHRVEVAASGDPRTNGGSALYYFYYYQESKATRRLPLLMNSSLQTLKLQPHAFPYLGTDLHITQLSNIGSFDHHHLSTTDCVSRQTPEPKIESYRTHRYLREYSGNTHANILNTLDPILDLIAPENTNAYAIPRWSLGDATIAAPGNKRTNEDSILKSTKRDAFPLRELRASQQTGDIAPPSTPSASDISRHDRSCLHFDFKNQYISIFRKYYRPGSHRLEVAAAGDPRTNGDSTLKSTIRDAFPLRELRASQETGDNAPTSTPSASDISRHDRSCLYFDFINQNVVPGRT
ncbi:hypothetical protein V1477_015563 [Vespula maculifrons]|uniref:Uncharacterized protein n=1 Tax=Vespula maculifrons TaxID=7453 RepID=A0ABD2BEM4_VESMC